MRERRTVEAFNAAPKKDLPDKKFQLIGAINRCFRIRKKMGGSVNRIETLFGIWNEMRAYLSHSYIGQRETAVQP